MVAQLDKSYVAQRPGRAIVRLISYALFEGRPLTTRGQWINPLVSAIYRLASRSSFFDYQQTPLFIVGTGRSGTTILGKWLSFHRDVGYLNEPKLLWHEACGFEDVIGSYSKGAARYVLGEDDSSAEIEQRLHRFFGLYRWFTRSGLVVDKYPELVFRVPFVKKAFPRAKFVFLVRNGWDTCQSIETWSKRLGVQQNGETHDWWGRNDRKWFLLVDELVAKDPVLGPHVEELRQLDDHVNRAAVEWVVSMNFGLEMNRAYPDDFLLIKYEDLVADVKGELTKICQFAGLANDPGFLEYADSSVDRPPEYSAFDLLPFVEESFKATMSKFGYLQRKV